MLYSENSLEPWLLIIYKRWQGINRINVRADHLHTDITGNTHSICSGRIGVQSVGDGRQSCEVSHDFRTNTHPSENGDQWRGSVQQQQQQSLSKILGSSRPSAAEEEIPIRDTQKPDPPNIRDKRQQVVLRYSHAESNGILRTAERARMNWHLLWLINDMRWTNPGWQRVRLTSKMKLVRGVWWFSHECSL